MFPNLTVADVLRAFWSTFVPVRVFSLNDCHVQYFKLSSVLLGHSVGIFCVVLICLFACFGFFFNCKASKQIHLSGMAIALVCREERRLFTGFLQFPCPKLPKQSGNHTFEWFKYISTKEVDNFLQDCQNSFLNVAEAGQSSQNWVIVSTNNLISVGDLRPSSIRNEPVRTCNITKCKILHVQINNYL